MNCISLNMEWDGKAGTATDCNEIGQKNVFHGQACYFVINGITVVAKTLYSNNFSDSRFLRCHIH